MFLSPIVVFFFGYPGSGKGVQAEKTVQEFGLHNFDTGRMLEAIFADPHRQGEEVIIREKHLFETGMLTTPSFVLGEVLREVARLAKEGQGLVFSGSPRTLFEAEGEIPVLEELYGNEKLFFFFLAVDPRVAKERNARRMTCHNCIAPILPEAYAEGVPSVCPRCGGPLYRRKLDDDAYSATRQKEYIERTYPVVEYIRGRGHTVHEIGGEVSPDEVFAAVCSVIKGDRKG